MDVVQLQCGTYRRCFFIQLFYFFNVQIVMRQIQKIVQYSFYASLFDFLEIIFLVFLLFTSSSSSIFLLFSKLSTVEVKKQMTIFIQTTLDLIQKTYKKRIIKTKVSNFSYMTHRSFLNAIELRNVRIQSTPQLPLVNNLWIALSS